MNAKSKRKPTQRDPEGPFVETQREVAHVFSVSRTTVQNWAANGMPGEPGRYGVRAIYHWREARNAEREKREGRSPALEALCVRQMEARVRSLGADAETRERKVRELRESMLPTNECELCLKLLKEAARKRFMTIPDGVKLAGIDKKLAAMIREELRHQVELVLIEMGDFHLPATIRR